MYFINIFCVSSANTYNLAAILKKYLKIFIFLRRIILFYVE